MIRRRVEYIIICDCLRICGYSRCDGCANAFNSDTMEDCALSPKCRKFYEECKAILDSGEES